ncbi:hypothetical protein GCM10023310_37630 [Paenibacillus vulneris]|uniref:VOC family protein n=1 Tax=Paenibacillus vulneris TaxID=1133364 RepID=A0ABW3UK62_9BACL|nr:VOC family protein [Paenibacillus sp. 32352]
MGKQISSSLTVLMVSDAERSQAFYRDVLGFDVTPWWAVKDGLHGLALKLLQAGDASAVRPNPPAKGSSIGVDVYAYVEHWDALDQMYNDFRTKGAKIAKEPVIYPDQGPWKEFIVEDPDGYHLAFGGINGTRAHYSIEAHVDNVVVWVRDIDRAVERYSRLMGLEVRKEDRHTNQLHQFHLANGTNLLLDSNGMEHIPVPEKGPVLFHLSTSNIDKAIQHTRECGFEVVYGIHRFDQVAFFNIRDEDGNIISVCQKHAAK